MEEITLTQAVRKCAELTQRTGKQWFFKGHKGTVKIVCDEDKE